MKINWSAFLLRRNLSKRWDSRICISINVWLESSKLGMLAKCKAMLMLVKYLLDNYFRSRTAPYMLIQLNASIAVHMVFCWESFVFFIILFLRRCDTNFKQTPLSSQTPMTVAQQTFQRQFNVLFRLIWRHHVWQRQINVETTFCTSTLKFTTSNNVKTMLYILTLNWTTLDNVQTTLSFSMSIFATLGNVETTLRIWPFGKKN